jgi:hypothetical protein
MYNPDSNNLLDELAGGLLDPETDDDDHDQVKERLQAGLYRLYKLWVLADFLGDTRIADQVVHELASVHEGGGCLEFSPETLFHVATQTSETSKLQRFTLDYLAANLRENDVESFCGHKLPVDFLLRIMRALLRPGGRRGKSMKEYLLR